LIYEMSGRRKLALDIAGRATNQVLHELDRHPDLAEFRQDPRFIELMMKSRNGGG
jgi:hypothetical protein